MLSTKIALYRASVLADNLGIRLCAAAMMVMPSALVFLLPVLALLGTTDALHQDRPLSGQRACRQPRHPALRGGDDGHAFGTGLPAAGARPARHARCCPPRSPSIGPACLPTTSASGSARRR